MVTVVLQRRAEPTAADFAAPALARPDLAERFGARPDDLAAVRAAAGAAGVEIVRADAASRLVRLRGTAQALGTMFGTRLERAEVGGRSFRQRVGELSVPADLAGAVVAVLGLDDRPQAQMWLRRPAAATSGYTPLQVIDAYDPPGQTDGTGQTLAIIELGGGFAASDLDAYFTSLGMATPSVSAVGVDGATNVPGADPTGADGEVLLDIEVAGAIAPGASIVVYFAPNTDAGFLDAITEAAHATPAPTAMSISWGQSEDAWTAQARAAMDQACADAALLGVTVLAAAGDSGSADGSPGRVPHVDFPASSPHVLGCGGTRLELSPSGAVAGETVWNDGTAGGATGGGVSDDFTLPAWQVAAGVPARAQTGGAGRGVPDVAGNADPQTGYRVRVDGQDEVIGGTSAVAPLWGGLLCRLAQGAGRSFGLLQPAFYAGASAGVDAPGFRDITSGDNGAYRAGPGWDACTGLGSPDGVALLARLTRAGAG